MKKQVHLLLIFKKEKKTLRTKLSKLVKQIHTATKIKNRFCGEDFFR